MRLNKKTLDGNIETLMLAVLSEGPSYGYQIVRELGQRTGGVLKLGEGTVYPVLHRMEARGLIVAQWRKGPTGRPRKYYRVTRRGGTALKQNTQQWAGLVQVMESVLGDAAAG